MMLLIKPIQGKQTGVITSRIILTFPAGKARENFLSMLFVCFGMHARPFSKFLETSGRDV